MSNDHKQTARLSDFVCYIIDVACGKVFFIVNSYNLIVKILLMNIYHVAFFSFQRLFQFCDKFYK
jgi:hypothetical protein